MRRRWYLIPLLLGLVPSTLAAQQDGALKAISALINDANREVITMQSIIDDLESRLSAWDADLNRSGQSGRVTFSTTSTEQGDVDTLAARVANHPAVALADPECRDDFRAVNIEQFSQSDRFRPNRLVNCTTTLRPTIKQPTDLTCANLTWVKAASGALHLEGYVQGTDDLAELKTRYGPGITSAVVERPEPVCTALTALEVPMTSDNKPDLALLSDVNKIGIGDSLAFEVTTPNFYSFLYIAYLQADGTVVNLLPRRALLRRQDPPRTRLIFGDGQQGRQTYTASQPTGTEAIIAIAARSPIAALEDLEFGAAGQYAPQDTLGRTLDHSVFLDLLGKSMDDLADTGGVREISAEVLHLTIVN